MKAGDLRQEPDLELLGRATKLREEIFNLHFKGSTEPISNPDKVREMRKDIARVETILTERALAASPRARTLSREERKRAEERKRGAAATAERGRRKKGIAAAALGKKTKKRAATARGKARPGKAAPAARPEAATKAAKAAPKK